MTCSSERISRMTKTIFIKGLIWLFNPVAPIWLKKYWLINFLTELTLRHPLRHSSRLSVNSYSKTVKKYPQQFKHGRFFWNNSFFHRAFVKFMKRDWKFETAFLLIMAFLLSSFGRKTFFYHKPQKFSWKIITIPVQCSFFKIL